MTVQNQALTITVEQAGRLLGIRVDWPTSWCGEATSPASGWGDASSSRLGSSTNYWPALIPLAEPESDGDLGPISADAARESAMATS